MDQIAKLKDAVVNYLSPAAKRRRTIGPQTPTHDAAGESLFLSEPRDKKALGNAYDRINQSYYTSPGRRQLAGNPLKRSRQDDETELRGHEPVLPVSWKAYHFKQVPEAMWDTEDKGAFIGYNLGDGERGFGALEELTAKLGWRLQARKSVNGPTEPLMEQIIQHYITWTEKDGGYHKKKFIPVLALIRGRWGATSSEVQKTLKDQMNYLAKQHRETLLLPKPITTATGEVEIYSRRPPIIYGILCAQMKTIFVTMDSSDPNAAIRHIGHCDFDDSTKHFWNGLSIAIVATVAKRYMMSIKDQLEDDPPVFDPYEDELESPAEAEERLRRQAKREKKQREREERLRLENEMNGVDMDKNEDQQSGSTEEEVEAEDSEVEQNTQITIPDGEDDENTETEQTGYAVADEPSDDDETEEDEINEGEGDEDEYQQDDEDEEMTDDYDGEEYPSSDELSHH
ncbi:hypothetical protein CJF30_00007356 [Rutstroemia sp. NJR-2017a BBW]|nr:hypothetical protein CJF30_00007356 [Rutstroemia sp. NJR-2017a BBW]